MKTSIKTSAILFLLATSAIAVKAQTTPVTPSSGGIIYSVGVETGISTGNFKDTHKGNIGGSIQADIPVANQLYATVTAGYTNFFGKDNVYGSGLSAVDLHYLPVMAGIKYFPISNFYVQGDAGAGFALNKKDQGYTKTAAFLYTPQVGVQFPFGSKSYIDAGVRYEATTDFTSNSTYNSKVNFFGLRVAYGFGL